jgi:hypothetical protein
MGKKSNKNIHISCFQGRKFLLVSICALLLAVSCQAQIDTIYADPMKYKGPVIPRTPLVKHIEPDQKDIIDVVKMAFFKNKKLEHKLFKDDSIPKTDSTIRKAGKLHTSVLPGAGYTLQTRFAGVIAANGAFYTDEDEHANLSVVNTFFCYTQNKQIILPVQSNIWTKGNKFNLMGDWRFYAYPQYTYGLGGFTSNDGADLLNYKYITIHQTVSKSLGHDWLAGVGYNLDYHWNITEVGIPGETTFFQAYGKAMQVKFPSSQSVSSGPSLNVLFDDRRNPIYPLRGSYLNVVYRHNFTFMGSDQNWQSFLVDFRKYFKVPGYKNSVLAFWSYSWLTFGGAPPYLDLPSTAWDTYSNMGRGYIQSRFRGQNLLYMEGEYRFVLTPNGLLGAVLFANAQSVTEWPSNKFEVVRPGAGLGVRVKVNKHSNTNVAIDYGWGAGGSGGLFINLGEVF